MGCFICVPEEVRDYMLPKLECLGFDETNVFSGRYQSHKKTPPKSIFIFDVFTPSANREFHNTRVRLLLRGNKEQDAETYECIIKIICCADKQGCTGGSTVDDPIYKIRRFSGPTQENDIDGFPIYTIDLDVFWLSK